MRKVIEFIFLILIIFFLQNLYKFQVIFISKFYMNIICILLLSLYTSFQHYKYWLLKIWKVKIKNLYLIIPLVLYSTFIFTDFEISNFSLEIFRNQEIFEIFKLKVSNVIIEELLFRIIVFFNIFSYFKNDLKYLPKTILLSSIVFGGIHFINFFTQDYSLVSALGQVFGAFAIGVLFTVIFLKCENIIIPIIIHSIINLNTAYSDYFSTAISDAPELSSTASEILGLVVLIFIYSIPLVISYLILKYKPIIILPIEN